MIGVEIAQVIGDDFHRIGLVIRGDGRANLFDLANDVSVVIGFGEAGTISIAENLASENAADIEARCMAIGVGSFDHRLAAEIFSLVTDDFVDENFVFASLGAIIIVRTLGAVFCAARVVNRLILIGVAIFNSVLIGVGGLAGVAGKLQLDFIASGINHALAAIYGAGEAESLAKLVSRKRRIDDIDGAVSQIGRMARVACFKNFADGSGKSLNFVEIAVILLRKGRNFGGIDVFHAFDGDVANSLFADFDCGAVLAHHEVISPGSISDDVVPVHRNAGNGFVGRISVRGGDGEADFVTGIVFAVFRRVFDVNADSSRRIDGKSDAQIDFRRFDGAFFARVHLGRGDGILSRRRFAVPPIPRAGA